MFTALQCRGSGYNSWTEPIPFLLCMGSEPVAYTIAYRLRVQASSANLLMPDKSHLTLDHYDTFLHVLKLRR